MRGWSGSYSLGLTWRQVESWDRVKPRGSTRVETLAAGAAKGGGVTQAWLQPRPRDQRGDESQEILATLAHLRDATRHEQEWFKAQGVISLSELWIAVHHPVSFKPEPAGRGTRVDLWGW